MEAKRTWLAQRLREGHVFRKLDQKATAMIEYAPLETAWVPAVGENFYYIYCLWTEGEGRGKGYGKALMEYCLEDARRNGRSGVCMLGANRQKRGFPTKNSLKSTAFRWWILPIMAMICWPSPLTEQPRRLPDRAKRERSKKKS